MGAMFVIVNAIPPNVFFKIWNSALKTISSMKYITFYNGVFTVSPVHKKFFFPGLSPFEYLKKGFR